MIFMGLERGGGTLGKGLFLKKVSLSPNQSVRPSFLPSFSFQGCAYCEALCFHGTGIAFGMDTFQRAKDEDFLKAFVRRFSGKPWPQRFAAAFLCIGEVRWWERALSAEI